MPRRFDDESDASRKSGSTVGSDTGDDADVQANGPTLVQAGAALADEEDDDADIVVRPRSRNVRTIAEDGAVANKVKNGKGGAATVKPSAAISALSNDEEDEDGNEKIDQDGALLPPRQYTSRAFRLPTRGDQFWFLATEIARVTGYRDSYLFFNKNKNLTKLITSDAEKSYLIAQELIPYSYRNRPIGIVSARKCYKTFGSKIIVRGKRVKDDYFVQRAIDQGFTEDMYANEEDKPAERTVTHESTQRRQMIIEAARNSKAKNIADYNAEINRQRQLRLVSRRLHFRSLAGS